MIWVSRHPRFQPEMLGFIPGFLSEDDERSAKEQIKANYIGGWHPMPKFEMSEDGTLTYDPNGKDRDPPLPVLCETRLRDETIYFYQHAWLCIVQPDGSFEVSRLD